MSMLSRVVLLLSCLLITSCSSNSTEQVACNVIKGGKGSSGIFDKLVNGAIYTIFVAPKDSCVKRKKNMCIDSEGKIEDQCVVNK